MSSLDISCQCGQLKGTAEPVTPGGCNRVVCYCKWCRGFVSQLGRDDILDELGGVHIMQMSPRSFTITEGRDNLACMTLSKTGPLRWYASCCKTPIANTFKKGGPPFMGLMIDACFPKAQTEGKEDALFGPLRVRVNRDFKPEDPGAKDATKLKLFGMLVSFVPKYLGWKLRGDGKRSTFFDAETGAPVATPTRGEHPDALEAATPG